MSTPAAPAGTARDAAASDTAVSDAAERLIAAETDHAPCAPVRDLIDRDNVERAYAVQGVLHARALRAGRRVAGRKIGLTSPVVQAQLGVDQPDFGFLYIDMDVSGADEIDPGRLLQPKIEAEVAFVLGADLDGSLDDATVAAAVAAVPMAALRWLAETAAHHGEPLRAGQVVLSGALGPMVPVAPGDEFHAVITGLDTVTARFASTQEDR